MNNIKTIRLQKGLTQKDVSLYAGVSEAAISMFERSKRKPSINVAFKIAKSLDVTVDELFCSDYKDE